jgi:hypothetical protein
MHRHRKESPAETVSVRVRIERAAAFATLVVLALLVLGALAWAVGLLPAALAALARPLFVMLAATYGVASLAQTAGALAQARPLRYSRAALALGAGVFMAAQFVRLEGLLGLEEAFAAVLAIGGVLGAALLADAVRDARRPTYPRLAVISSALAGTGILMLVGTMVLMGEGDVWNRAFLMGVGLLAAAGFGVLRLRRAHLSRAEMLARMGLGD